jgi:hypothetical protein
MPYTYGCFSPTMWKIKFSYAFSEIPYFYDSEKLRTFGVLNRILQNTGKELFKTDQTRTVLGKWGRMGSSLVLGNHV